MLSVKHSCDQFPPLLTLIGEDKVDFNKRFTVYLPDASNISKATNVVFYITCGISYCVSVHFASTVQIWFRVCLNVST